MANLDFMCTRSSFSTKRNVIVRNRDTFNTLRSNSQWASATLSAEASSSASFTISG